MAQLWGEGASVSFCPFQPRGLGFRVDNMAVHVRTRGSTVARLLRERFENVPAPKILG